MNERREFVAGLRRERERRGITLDEVAEQTKINVALLAGLERGDLTRWPTGIFRRSFVRGYAVSIGLAPDAVVCAFARYFPDTSDGGSVTVPPFEHAASTGGDRLRLTLDSHPRPSMRVLGLRTAAAALDVVVVASGGVVGTLAGFPFAAVALAVAAVYFTVGTIVFEASPGWSFARRHVRVRRAAAHDVDAEIVLDAGADVEDAGARRPADQPPPRPGRRDRRPGRNERQRVARGGARRVS